MKKKKVKRKLLKFCGLWLLGSAMYTPIMAQQINYQVNPHTGALQTLTIADDPQGMNWLVATDGSQYPWLKDNYGWGLGYFTQTKGARQDKVHWNAPAEMKQGGKEIVYFTGDIRILVKRYMREEDLVEEYIFQNR